MSPKLLIILVVFLLLANLAAAGLIFAQVDLKDEIEIPDQPVGETVYVRKVTLTEAGFLIVAASEYGKALQTEEGIVVTAITENLKAPGTYEDFFLRVNEADGLTPVGELVGIIFNDTNKNGFYDSPVDKPRLGLLQNRVEEKFNFD